VNNSVDKKTAAQQLKYIVAPLLKNKIKNYEQTKQIQKSKIINRFRKA
jgi:hypothetical protein